VAAGPTHTPLQLLDLVREVARVATPDPKGHVTQSAWNTARDGASASASEAPSAHAICQRLGVSWTRVLAIAHGPAGDALRQLRVDASDRGRKGWTRDDARYALRRASLRLERKELTRSDYQHAREQMISCAPRGAARRIAERSMPTLNQLEEVLAKDHVNWQAALAEADLAAPPPQARRGLNAPDAVALFARHTGKLPASARQLIHWARANQISIHNTTTKQVQTAIKQLRRERKAQGLPALPLAKRGPPPSHESEAESELGNGFASQGAASDGRQPAQNRSLDELRPSGRLETASERAETPAMRVRGWNRAKAIEGLARAVQLLGPGEQLSQRTLKRIAAGHPHEPIPSWSTVDRTRRRDDPNATWDDWRRAAEELDSGCKLAKPALQRKESE